ncbi:MAG TPA: hypothetical protein ENH80_00625 [Phycisphaerae bacterium]|nr:hypothetical protein [Phycisphaerae bacterium]HDZ42424.1 hypothetical protein [Phycisphaerae bacterium]
MVIFVAPDGHAPAGSLVEPETTTIVADTANGNGVGQYPANGGKGPRAATPGREALVVQPVRQLLESDRRRQISPEGITDSFGLTGINRHLPGAILSNDLVAIGRTTSSPLALLEALQQAVPSPFGKYTRIMLRDNELDAPG